MEQRFYDWWMQEMVSYPVSSSEENARLANRYKGGDELAIEELIRRNKRMIYSVALGFSQDKGILEELFQAGEMAIEYAARQFDETKGAFSTIAVPSIKRFMNVAFAKCNRNFVLPHNFSAMVRVYNTMLSKGYQEERIIEKLKLKPESLELIKRVQTPGISMQEPVKINKEKLTVGSYLESDDHVENSIDFVSLYGLKVYLKSMLSDYEYFVFYYRHLCSEDYTYKEIADMLNTSKQNICNCDARVSDRVKKVIMSGEFLSDYKSDVPKRLNTEPVNPCSIVDYLFVREYLTDIEQRLFVMYIYRERNYPLSYYARFLGLSEGEVRKVLKRIDEVLRERKAVCSEEYEQFKEEVLSINIFDVDMVKSGIAL